jgi:hypothetical protein
MGWRRTPKKKDNDEIKAVVKAIREGSLTEATRRLSALLDKVHDRAEARAVSEARYDPHDVY